MHAGAGARPHFTQPGLELPQLQHRGAQACSHTHRVLRSATAKIPSSLQGGMSSIDATRFQVFRGISSSLMQQLGDRTSALLALQRKAEPAVLTAAARPGQQHCDQTHSRDSDSGTEFLQELPKKLCVCPLPISTLLGIRLTPECVPPSHLLTHMSHVTHGQPACAGDTSVHPQSLPLCPCPRE